MKIWKSLFHSSVIVSCLLFAFKLDANTPMSDESKKNLIIESNSAKFKPCISKPGFLGCPNDFYLSNSSMTPIYINIKAVNGTFDNVHLESRTNNILSEVYVTPSSCSVLAANQICTFTIQYPSGYPFSGIVNVVANNKVFLSFTLYLTS